MKGGSASNRILALVQRTHALIIGNSLSNREVHKETSTPRRSVWGLVILAHPRPMVREGTLYIPTPPEVSDPSISKSSQLIFVVFENKHGLPKIRHLSLIGSNSWHQNSKHYSYQYLKTISS